MDGLPDLSAGSTAKQLLSDIHRGMLDVNRHLGRQEGVMDEMGRQLIELGRTLHAHIDEENGVAQALEQLRTDSRERHERLHDRLDKLETAAVHSKIRWGVVAVIATGVATIVGWFGSVLLSAGVKPAWDAAMHWLTGTHP